MHNTKICSRCVMDSNVPGICFDDNNVCNYCKQFDRLCEDNPIDARGKEILDLMFHDIKQKGKNSQYDVIIGVSGGTDSTYLVHMAVEYGLRPLAVHLDNGWNSEISVTNIKSVLEKHNIDLITHVVNYDEMKDIMLSFMKASLPWIDGPTDIALMSTIYRTAAKFNISYVLVGNNFRTEGRQPDAWTHVDGRMVKYVQRKYGSQKLKTFPNLTALDLLYFGAVKKIRMIRPLNFLNYNKKEVQSFITEKYGWKNYGGHHHENVFTKFAIAYWLPKKFNIDKRKVTYSACVRSGEMTRAEAQQKLLEPPYDPKLMEEDKNYVIKKLGIVDSEFEQIWNLPNKSFLDYPSYYPLYLRFRGMFDFAFKYILPFKPMLSYEMNDKKV